MTKSKENTTGVHSMYGTSSNFESKTLSMSRHQKFVPLRTQGKLIYGSYLRDNSGQVVPPKLNVLSKGVFSKDVFLQKWEKVNMMNRSDEKERKPQTA